DLDHPFGDGRPAELLDGAGAACLAEAVGKGLVREHRLDPLGEVADEGRRVGRLSRAVVTKLERDEQACDTVLHDLWYAPGARCDNRPLARHRLEVHDPEWFIDRRTYEHGRVAQHLYERGARQHLFDPGDPLPGGP